MVDDSKYDCYYDSDSTSSDPTPQSRSNLEWQNAVDENGHLFFVKRLAPRQHPGSTSSSTLNVNYYNKTSSGFFGKLIRRRSSRRGDEKFGATSEWCQPKLNNEKEETNLDSSFFGILYTTVNEFEESAVETNLMYSYPPTEHPLSSARGLFITLLHLLPTVTSSRPILTSYRIESNKINVAYHCEGDDVLLLALPDSRFCDMECRRILNECCSYQKFVHQTLPKCYASPINNFSDLDAFFCNFFRNLDSGNNCSFPESLHTSFEITVPFLSVPRDINRQVEDALNELESNEILSEHDDRRRFSIIGSAYFFKGYAVCSHLSKSDLLEVYQLLRVSGIVQYSCDGVKDLIYWKEIYPLTLNRGLVPPMKSPYTTPGGRWFLLVVALGHNTLITLLECGGCTYKLACKDGPDSLYIDEAHATLRHIIKLGTAHFLSKMIGEHEPQIREPEEKYPLGRSSQSLVSLGEASYHQGSVKSFELLDYDAADDSMPVLGRRAERQLNEITYHSSLNLVDPVDDRDSNKETKSSEHLSEGSDHGRRTGGEGLLISNHRLGGCKYDRYFHYVQLDSSEGIVISNLFAEPSCPSFSRIMGNFKEQARQIQRVFKTTLSFQKKTSDLTTTPMNKSMVALKEYGTLFEMEEEETSESILYWVVGRLISSPSPRELYVCYQDNCPQNLIELAFHLSFTSLR